MGDAGPLRLVVLVNTPMSIPDKRHVLRQVHDLIGPKGVMVYLPDRNEGLIGSWLMTALKTGFAFAQTMQLPDPVNQCPALVASRRLPICSAGTRLKFS